MSVTRSPIRLGLAVAGFGALANAATVFLAFVLPQRILTGETASAYLDAWLVPVATAGEFLVGDATPLLAGLAGFYLVYKTDVATRDAVVGFLVGGVAFAVGVTAIGLAVTPQPFRAGAFQYAVGIGLLVGRFFGVALLGIVVGEIADQRGGSLPRLGGERPGGERSDRAQQEQ